MTFCLHQVIYPVVVNLSGGKMAILLLYLVSAPIGREGEGATSANPFNFTLSGLSCGPRPSCLFPPYLPPPTCDMLQSIRSSDSATLAAADHFFTFNAPISSKGGRTGGRTTPSSSPLPPRSLSLWRNGQASGLFLSRASEPRQTSKGSFRGMSHDVSGCLFP